MTKSSGVRRLLLISPLLVVACLSQKQEPAIVGQVDEVEYSRPAYRFRALVPRDWTLFGERDQDGQLILSFSLPRVWSEEEQQEIENDISVTAYHKTSIKSLGDMIAYDLRRMESILDSSEETKGPFGKSFIQKVTIDGLHYKSMSVLHYYDEYGYVVSFTATKGTYDRNLPRFLAFCKTLNLPGLK